MPEHSELIAEARDQAAKIQAVFRKPTTESKLLLNLVTALESSPVVSPTREEIVAALITQSENDHDFDPEWNYRPDAERYADAVLALLTPGLTERTETK